MTTEQTVVYVINSTGGALDLYSKDFWGNIQTDVGPFVVVSLMGALCENNEHACCARLPIKLRIMQSTHS